MPPASSPGSHGQPTEHTSDRVRRTPDRAAKVRFRRAVTLMVMTLFLPGSAQILEGKTLVGVIALFLFFIFVSAALAVGRLAPAIGPVADSAHLMIRVAAITLAVLVWLFMSLPVYRRRATV